MIAKEQLKDKIRDACNVAEEFTKIYYESIDRMRHQLSRQYMDTALLVWNGTGSVGKDQIQKFLEALPTSQHSLTSLDAQPVLEQAVSGQFTLLIQAAGSVHYGSGETKPFHQTFLITAQGDKWKIVSDCFRLQEPIDKKKNSFIVILAPSHPKRNVHTFPAGLKRLVWVCRVPRALRNGMVYDNLVRNMSAFSSDGERCIEQRIESCNVCPTPLDSLRNVYELDRCDEWIRKHQLSKVCLQFPDDLLCDAADILLSLQHSSGAQCFILGDTSYGSCCVDEVSAEHIQADGIIHFGHACLSPTRRLPVLYIFKSKPLDSQKLLQAMDTAFEDINTKLLIIFDVAYSNKIDCVHDTLSQKYPNVVSAFPKLKATYTEEKGHSCLGCRFILKEGTNLEDYSVLFIGTDGRTFTNYLLDLAECKMYQYDPEELLPSVHPADSKISKFLMKRLHLVERVKDAKTLGILIGTLGVDGYLDAVDHIKLLAKKTRKKTYIFAVGRPNIPKLANFPEVDVFVLVACPENSLLDWKEFYQPVVSLYEVELACNPAREFSSRYVSNFRQLLNGGFDYVQLPDVEGENLSDVSLITGKVRTVDFNSADDKVNDHAVAQRADLSVCLSSGSQFLASRTWRGLEQNLGQTPVELAIPGRSGVASGYLSEPLQDDN